MLHANFFTNGKNACEMPAGETVPTVTRFTKQLSSRGLMTWTGVSARRYTRGNLGGKLFLLVNTVWLLRPD